MTDLMIDGHDEPVDHPLLGCRVVVYLDDRDDDVTVRGVLRTLTACGDVEVEDDDGTRTWAWPALVIKPA